MAYKVDQFRGGMQPLARRHRPNKLLERCRFPVNQVITRGDVHDLHGNGVFANASDLHEIGGSGMCGVRNRIPLKEYQHFKRRGENINNEEQGKK